VADHGIDDGWGQGFGEVPKAGRFVAGRQSIRAPALLGLAGKAARLEDPWGGRNPSTAVTEDIARVPRARVGSQGAVYMANAFSSLNVSPAPPGFPLSVPGLRRSPIAARRVSGFAIDTAAVANSVEQNPSHAAAPRAQLGRPRTPYSRATPPAPSPPGVGGGREECGEGPGGRWSEWGIEGKWQVVGARGNAPPDLQAAR